jgi:cytoskeletal protein RodZ
MSDVPGTDVNKPDMTVKNRVSAIGERLSAARKKKKLNVESVAKQLHLDVNIIKALETDDASSLPAAIFVQGYLRSYARLVDLSEEEIIRQYNGEHHEPPPLSVANPVVKLPMFRLPSGRHIRNAILLMLCLMLLWLAYPFVERLVSDNRDAANEQVPGQLELPLDAKPVN